MNIHTTTCSYMNYNNLKFTIKNKGAASSHFTTVR